MASSEAAKATAGGDIAESSEATVEIKIKTLDSQTYTLRVDKSVPVPALKEQIASVTGVLSEQQRLICRGRVLKDDQLLSAYHVEDGHTLHLVVRQPPQLSTPSTSNMGSEGATGHQGTNAAPGGAHNRGSQVAHSFVFESVNLDQGDLDSSLISRIISGMLDSIGSASTGTGNIENDVREMISERLQQASGDSGVSDSPQPPLNPTNPQSARQQGDARFSSTISSGSQNAHFIPDSLSTLSQYIGVMRDEFRREGFGANETAGTRLSEGRDRDSHSPAAQLGLPTPTSLAEILLSARQLLMDQTGDCLSQLGRQLGDHSSITDPLARMNIQSAAMRSGVLMRNLGSMLLELSRTTMTLRMGQSPAEAIVNTGPANYISATGPNPLMVQAVPFYPGGSTIGGMGPLNSGYGVGGEPQNVPIVPRNIEIRIRTSRGVPVAGTNSNEPAAAQQQQEQTEPMRNSSSANVVHQSFSGGDSGVRVVPLRTVVAMPSGVNPLPADSIASSVRLFYPLLARVRPTSAGNARDARGTNTSNQTQQGAAEVDNQPIHQFPLQRENLDPSSAGTHVSVNGMSFGISGLSPSANETSAHEAVFVSSQQSPPNNNSESRSQANDDTVRVTESDDTARAASEPGAFFSTALRQLMPLISQVREQGPSPTNPSSSTTQVESGNTSGSSSRHQLDPPAPPSPKRTKRSGD